MVAQLYEWIRRISVFLVLTTVIIHVLPKTDYKPYIQFYMGLVLIVLVLMPVLHFINEKQSFDWKYQEKEYEAYLRQVEEVTDNLNDVYQSETGEIPE